MFDTGFIFVLIFLGIVLWSRMKLIAQVQKRETAASMNKPQTPRPLPQQMKQEPAKTVYQPMSTFEGRVGGIMSSNLDKKLAQKGFKPTRSPMISGLTDSSEGFDREWYQGTRDVQKQIQLGREVNKPIMSIFARENLLQAFVAHEVFDKPKFRQGGRRV